MAMRLARAVARRWRAWPETGSDKNAAAPAHVEMASFIPANCGWNAWRAAVLSARKVCRSRI
jgi:hypothetical protein